MIVAGARVSLPLPRLAQFAGGDLVVPGIPADPAAREAFLRSGTHGASIDTRSLEPGQLFVPLPGTRTDGHAFLDEAFRRGAGAALCDREHHAALAGREPGPLVVVENVTLALALIARRHRETWPGLLIGITGSTGKTTTKELVAAALATAGPTLKTEGNLNNHWGVPLTLLGLEPEHRAAVVEMAMNAPGEIEALAHVAIPNEGIITNAGTAHLERFGTTAAIAHEKAALARALAPGRRLFAGADSPALLEALRGLPARIVTYGLAKDAEVHPDRVEDLGADGSRVEVRGFPPLHLKLIGRHQVSNALAALAVAREHRLEPGAAVTAIESCRPVHGRMELRKVRGATLLVDCYNANPDATAAALDTLARWPGASQRIALLGDMLELGERAVDLHRETGARVKGAELWSVGRFADAYASGARAAGVTSRTFEDKPAARRALLERLAPGVVVLLKASRGAALEDVLDGLEAGGD
jgi:UDP-N-acetylmuramoyl-tripeptide--D-alanyl-D-alanine ligase